MSWVGFSFFLLGRYLTCLSQVALCVRHSLIELLIVSDVPLKCTGDASGVHVAHRGF